MNTLGDLIKISIENKPKRTEVIFPLYLSLRDRYGDDWCTKHLIVLVQSTQRQPKRINYKRAKNGKRTRTSEQNQQ